MTTLFQRITGDYPANENSLKIPIHPLTAALYELSLGNITANQVAAFFNLDAEQKADGAILMGFITDAPNKADMIRVMKDWFYLAEWGNSTEQARYFSQANFIARLNQEKARQG